MVLGLHPGAEGAVVVGGRGRVAAPAAGDVDGVGDLRVRHAVLAAVTAVAAAAALHDAPVLGGYSVMGRYSIISNSKVWDSTAS